MVNPLTSSKELSRNSSSSVRFRSYHSNNKNGVKAFFFNPTDEPILKEALKVFGVLLSTALPFILFKSIVKQHLRCYFLFIFLGVLSFCSLVSTANGSHILALSFSFCMLLLVFGIGYCVNLLVSRSLMKLVQLGFAHGIL
jgi:hypothetical protein